MRTIQVNLSRNNYKIQIGSGLLSQVGNTLIAMGFRGKAVIITNPTVRALYGEILLSEIRKAGFETVILEVPDGEEYKSLEWAGRLYNQLHDFQTERMTPVLALGGGVIGDLAGFVAATFMRGLPLLQLPTTLLAQVDSSIGGKVAVNHGKLKNTVGTFYQPQIVIADNSVLKTLPGEEIANGMAEIIKYGIIRDQGLFEIIEKNLDNLSAQNESLLEELIARCAAIKAEVVEKDETDLGPRNILNLGHTIGHAIETASDFQIEHGKGVAVGIIAAGKISRNMGILSQPDLERMGKVISEAGLPVRINGLKIADILQAMQHDKKKAGGKVRFVLPKKIGDVFISDEVTVLQVERVLEELI